MANRILTRQATEVTQFRHKKLLVLWAFLVLLGYGSMVFYSTTPAKSSASVEYFPSSSSAAAHPLSLRTDGLTLITFLHPQCPCSRATVSELQNILRRKLGRDQAQLSAFAVVSRPSGCAESFAQGAIVDSLKDIADIKIVIDKDDIESRRFGAISSGQTLLFDKNGKCLFAGGITPARGEVGENGGTNALLELIARQPSSMPVRKNPVFGCSLESNQ